MADVSLDDYIQKKNFTVKIRNIGNKDRNEKSGFPKGGIKFTKQGGNNKVSFQNQKNVSIQKQRNGRFSLQTNKSPVFSLQTRKNKGLQDTNRKPLSVTVPGFKKTDTGLKKGAFDARDRIAAASRPKDAREKLAAKVKLKDARMRIQQMKNKQSDTNNGNIIITGLGKTLKTINTEVKASPNFTRNVPLTNNTVQQGGVQMSGNLMTITRKIDNSNYCATPKQPQIPVSNQENASLNFKITRTLGNKQDNQQGGGGGVQMSGNSMTITRNVCNYSPVQPPQNIQMTKTRGTVLEVANNNYQVPTAPSLDSYYEEYEEPSGYQYIQPQQTKTHVTEKTLTVKYPQTVRQKPSQVVITKPPIHPAVPPVKTVTAIKRKATTQGPLKLSSTSGPLKLVGGPLVLAKSTMASDTIGVVKKPKIVRTEVKQEYTRVDEDVSYQEPSPLQGFKVNVANLHPVVSQDDIIELFGAVGAMKRARLIKEGVAEVVYVQKDDATKAIQKYHNRELDGIPMQVKLSTPKPLPTPKPPPPAAAPVEEMPPPKIPAEPLKLFKGTNKNAPESDIETGTLHRALFKTGITQPSKLVTFTVKI